ncbi:hypothetical protein GcM1_024002, partial [Golovinomyces cichoracearum]
TLQTPPEPRVLSRLKPPKVHKQHTPPTVSIPLTRSQKRAITFESNRNSSTSQNTLDNLSNIKQGRIDQRTRESSQYPQTSHPQYASKKQELQGEWDNIEEDRQQKTKDSSTLASQFSRELGYLAKFYNDDMKYGGAEDSLDICLENFENTCLNARCEVKA